jgi:hypothetical protein
MTVTDPVAPQARLSVVGAILMAEGAGGDPEPSDDVTVTVAVPPTLSMMMMVAGDGHGGFPLTAVTVKCPAFASTTVSVKSFGSLLDAEYGGLPPLTKKSPDPVPHTVLRLPVKVKVAGTGVITVVEPWVTKAKFALTPEAT